MKQRKITNEDRRQWIENDEGLYLWKRQSRLTMREFIKENKEEIDKVINNVLDGNKRAHYLRYG